MKKGKSKAKAPERSRLPVSLRMSAKTKKIVAAAAEANQLSQSAQIEALIERAVTYDAMLAAMNTTMADIKKGKLETALREAGYTALHTPHGKAWLPPGHPGLRSGFIDQETEK